MWARKIDWKFCCRRNYCSYFFFFRVTEFINVSSYAIYAAHLQCNFSISFVDGIEVVFHSIAHYTDANIVSQVCLIFINTNCQSTINQSILFQPLLSNGCCTLTAYFPPWILHQFLAIQFIHYLILEFIRAAFERRTYFFLEMLTMFIQKLRRLSEIWDRLWCEREIQLGESE